MESGGTDWLVGPRLIYEFGGNKNKDQRKRKMPGI